MNAAFEALFVQHAMSSYAKQLALLDAIGEAGEWSVNLGQGTLTLDATIYQAGLLGSYNKQDHSWLWSWANPSMDTLPDHVTAVAKQMRALGESSAIPLLRDSTTPALDEDECHRLAMVVVGLSPGCGAYYRGPYGGGAAYLLVQQPVPVNLSVIRIQRVIMECVTQFRFPEGTHHDAITSFFRSVGLKVERSEPTNIFGVGRDGTVQVTLDERGRVSKAIVIPARSGGPLLFE